MVNSKLLAKIWHVENKFAFILVLKPCAPCQKIIGNFGKNVLRERGVEPRTIDRVSDNAVSGSQPCYRYTIHARKLPFPLAHLRERYAPFSSPFSSFFFSLSPLSSSLLPPLSLLSFSVIARPAGKKGSSESESICPLWH